MTTASDAATRFHVGLGGPFYRVERASRLGLGGRVLASIAVTWVPLVLFAIIELIRTGRVDPALRDLALHARFLVALPVLLLAERKLDAAANAAVQQVLDEELVPPEHLARFRVLLGRITRLCEASGPEALLLVLAFGLSIAGWAGLFHLPGTEGGLVRQGLVGAWISLVSLPFFQFLLWRTLFRWALWVSLLVGLARLPLSLRPTHADCRAGLSFLKRPSILFGSLLLLSLNSVLCAGFAREIFQHGAQLTDFKAPLVAFVLVGVVIALAPLLLFVPHLVAARKAGRRRVHALVNDYSARFEARWLERTPNPATPRPDLLGSPDMQSLADLGSAYRDTVTKIQLLLVGPRDLIVLFVLSQLPAIPLLFSQLPAKEALAKILGLLGGGLG